MNRTIGLMALHAVTSNTPTLTRSLTNYNKIKSSSNISITISSVTLSIYRLENFFYM